MKDKELSKRKNRSSSSDTPQRQGVNLKELAAHLGLSLTTVSRVMNQSATEHRIAPSTEKRVLEAAASLNYEPNAFARGLRKKQSFTIGVIVPEISEGYSAAVLGGIEEALLKEKFFYFVVSHHHRNDLLEGYPRLLMSRSVEGIIAVDTPIKEKLPIPVVAVSGNRKRNGVLTIELDHLDAVRSALSHLSELGHKQIAFIKGQSFSSDTTTRWNAIRKSCAALNLEIEPALVVQLEGTSPGSEPGYMATKKLLSTGEPFTAVVSFNDVSAIGAITALHEAGLHVPRDVSVIGFDDIPGAATIRPALTTIRQPLFQMGQIAANNLLRLIREDGDPTQEESVLVRPNFIIRRSTDRIPPKNYFQK